MRYKPVRSHIFDSMPSFALLLSIAAAGADDRPPRRAADQPAAAPSSAVLHLTDGSFVPGDLDDSTRPGVFRWQASAFVSPFEFPVNRVNAIHWPPPAAIAQARQGTIVSSWLAATCCSALWSPLTTSKPSSTFRGSAGCKSSARPFTESIAGAAAPTWSIWDRTDWPAGARRRRSASPRISM